MLQRIKRERSHSGCARIIAEMSDDPIAWLARVQIEDIPSPYAYSPTVAIFKWHTLPVVLFETSHRCYDLFVVPPELLRFDTEQDAANWHVRYSRKVG